MYRLVRSEWCACRPHEQVQRFWLRSRDFHIVFFRSLAEGIEVSSEVEGWQIEPSEWFIRVRMAILDQRVTKLRSEVVAHSETSNFPTLDFDVLAAAAAMEGHELEPAPLVEPPGSDDAARRVVKEFSDKIDRIWTFAGGFTIDGLETLSIWVIRNRTIVGVPKVPPRSVFAVVCTAFVYGERELAREVVREYELFLERRRRSEVVDEETRAIHARLSEDVARLRDLVS
jgi:hypothetical protein